MDYTWNDADGDWNVPGNWTPAAVPGAGDKATINRAGRTVDLNNFDPDVGELEFLAGNILDSGGLPIKKITVSGGGVENGNVTITGGSFDTAIGLVMTKAGSVINASLQIGSLTIDPTAGSITVATNDLDISGDLGVSTGTFDADTFNITVGDALTVAGTLDFSGNGNLTIGGNTTFPGDYSKGTGTVIFNAGAPQTLTSTGEDLGNVQVSAGGTDLQPQDAAIFNDLLIGAGAFLTTNSIMTIAGDLSGTGTFNAGAGDITFTGNPVGIGLGLTTTGGDIIFNNAVNLTSNVALDSGGGNILFSSTIATVGNDLGLDGGAAGNITISGALTGGGDMTVTDGNIQSYAALTVNSLDIQDATTSVTLGGNITATTTLDVNSGGIFTLSNGITAASAGGNITVDTTGAGALNVNGTIASAGAGTITLTASNAIVMDADSLLQTVNGTITASSAAGGITVDEIKSTGDRAISLTATGSTITEADNSALIGDVGSASILTLTAGTGIGGAAVNAELNTDVASITASTTGSGDIYIDEADSVTLTNIDTIDGAITITAGGAMTATLVDSSNTDDGTNSISLTTTVGSIDVGQVSGGVANDVTLTSAVDITDSGAGITGDVLTADAVSGMILDTDVGSIDAATSAAGNIVIDELNSLTVTAVTAANGDVSITTGSWLRSAADDGIADVSGNTLAFTVNTNGIGQVGTHLDVTAVTSFNAAAADGSDIYIDSIGNLLVGTITATVGGDITVASTGNISNLGAGFICNALNASSAGAMALDTAAASITAVTSGAGNISIDEANAVTLTNITTNNGAITVNTAGQTTVTNVSAGGGAGDSVSITAVGLGFSILVGSITAADVVTLTCTGDIQDTADDTNVDITAGGLITMTTWGNIDAGGGAVVDDYLDLAAGSNVDASSTLAGSLNLRGAGALTLTAVDTFDGAITVTAGGVITATLVDSSNTNNEANDITLTTTAGNIDVVQVLGGAGQANDVTLSSAGSVSDSGAGVTGEVLTVTSGAGSDIDLNSAVNDVVSAVISGGNDVTIVNSGALDLGTSTVAGICNITAGGNITDSGDLDFNGASSFTAPNTTTVILDRITNDFTGAVSFFSGGTLTTITVTDANSVNVAAAAATGSITIRSNDIVLSGVISAGVDLNFYTTTAATAMGIGGGAGAYQLSDADIVNVTGAGTIRIGEFLSQSGLITLQTVTSPVAAAAIEINSIVGGGGIVLDDAGAGTAFATGGTGSILLRAGTGDISSAQADNAFAELSTTGTITLISADVIGTAANSIQFLSNQDDINIANTGAGNVFLDGLGNLTLATIDTNGGDLTVNTAGDIEIGSIDAGAGDAIINSAGNIDDAQVDAVLDIIASNINLDAADGIGETQPLELEAAAAIDADTTAAAASIVLNVSTAAFATLSSISTTGAGSNITIDSSGGGSLTVTSAITVDGQIDISSDNGNMTATTITAGGANNILLDTTTAGNIIVGTLTAAGDQVTINSVGSINDDGAGTPDITANIVDFDAATGIGNTNAIELSGVATITADNTGAAVINIDNDHTAAVTVNSLTTAGANITFDQTGVGGTLDIAGAVTSGGSDVTITSAEALTVNAVINTTPGVGGALSASGVALNVAPVLGGGNISITGSSPDTIIAIATASAQTITLTADQDILIRALLQTTAAAADIILNADSDADGSGGVRIEAAGQVDSFRHVSISGADLFNDGGAGNTTESVQVDNNGAANQIQAAGNITLGPSAAAAVGTDIDILGRITSTGGGTISITAQDDILLTTIDGDISSSGGNITFTADAAGGGTVGVVSMADGIIINAGAGTVTINADGDIALSSIQTVNNTAAAVSITSTNGAITDNGDTHQDIQATGALALVTLKAETGIGNGNSLETTITEINAINDTSGNIEISETGALSIAQVTQSTTGNISITAGGSITADSGGAPANVISTLLTGTVTLDANGVAADINLNDGISTAAGNITLTADNDVIFAADGDITSASGDVSVTADADNGGLNSGALTMVDGTVISSGSGDISLDADEDIILGRLVTTSAAITAVSVTSVSGAILDTADAAAIDIVATNAASDVTLSAATTIGVLGGNVLAAPTNAIEVDIRDLVLTGNATDIAIASTTSGVNSLEVDMAPGAGAAGDVLVTTDDDLRIGIWTLTAGDSFGLVSSGGNVTVPDAPINVGGGTIRIEAATAGQDVLDAGDTALNNNLWTAGNLVFSSGTGESLTTSIDTLTAAITGAGNNLTVNEAGGIDLVSLDVADGSIIINAAGAVTITDVATGTDADDNDITISTTAGNIEVDIITTTGAVPDADVTLTANTVAGQAVIDADADSTISCDLLDITARGDIGTGAVNRINTTVASLNLSSTNAGDIFIRETNAVVLSDIDAANGQINIIAGNSIDAVDVATLTNLDSNDITIRATVGNIDIDTVSAAGIGDVDIFTDTVGGQEVEDPDTDSLITADELRIVTTAGIGNLNRINTAVDSAALQTATGDIRIGNNTDLRVESIAGLAGVQITAGAAGDDIDIYAQGFLRLADEVSNTGGGDIILAADGSAVGNNLWVGNLPGGTVSAVGGNGAVFLYAGDTVAISEDVSASGTGTVLISAGTDYNQGGGLLNGNAAGAIIVADTYSVLSDDGNVTLRAPEDISLAFVSADGDSAGAVGNVTIEADYAGSVGGLSDNIGAVTDSSAAETANIYGNIISITGPSGIGAAAAGDIEITVDVTRFDADSSGGNGDVYVTTTGAMPIGFVDAGTGNVTLVSGGAVTDADGLADVLATTLSLTAAGAITVDTTVDNLNIQTTAAGLIDIAETDAVNIQNVIAANGDVDITTGGATVITSIVSSTDLEANDITVTASAGDIEIDTITTGGTASDVILQGTLGAIIDADGDSTITTQALSLTARDNIGVIGGANRIGTTSETIIANSTLDGDIALNETGAVTLTSVTTTDGAIEVLSGNTMTVTTVTSGDAGGDETHDVTLTVNPGNIVLGSVTADNEANLSADAGSITAIGPGLNITAVDLDLSAQVNIGDITGFAAETGDAVEVNISGTVKNVSTSAVGEIYLYQNGALALGAGALDIAGGNQGEAIIEATGSLNMGAAGAVALLGNDSLCLKSGGTLTLPNTITTGGDLRMTGVADVVDSGGTPRNIGFASGDLFFNSGAAGGNTTLTTSVATLTAHLTNAADLTVTETNGINLTDIDTSNGAITVTTAAGAVIATNVDSSATDDDSNDITITSVGGGITAGIINAGAVNDVTLVSGVAITDAAGKISADILTADASGAMTLNTTVASVNASTSAPGAMIITETNSITLTDIDTANGTITVTTAAGAVIATDVDSSATDDDLNDITITSVGGGITAGIINAGALNDVNLTSGGAITDAAGKISADILTADAAGAMTLNTTVASVNASTSAAGAMIITETNSITLTDIDTANGTITVTTAAGAVIATDVDSSATDDDLNDITITSVGGGITAGIINAGALNDVNLTSGGAITDAAGKISADILTADAAGAMTLNTTVASVNASTSAPGAMIITETNSITLTDIDTANGTITVTTAAGAVIATDVDSSATDDDLNDITITSVGGGITAGIINAGALNDVNLTSGGAITDAAGKISADILTADAAGAMTLNTTVASVNASTSAAGAMIITESDAIILTDIDTTNGAITVTTAAGAVTATDVDSSLTDNDLNDITITSVGGGIIAGIINAGAVNDVSLVSGVAITDAVGKIICDVLTADAGGAMTLDTTVSSIDASTSAAGAMVITETNAVTLSDVDAVNGNITVVSGGAMTATAVDTTTAGDITLNANGTLLAAHVYTLDGSIDLDAAGTLTATDVQANDSGTTGAYNAVLDTTTGGMVLTAVTADNDITGTAVAGDITLGLLTSGNNTSLQATAGEIIDGNGGANNIQCNLLTIDSVNGVGSLNAIETTVGSIDIDNTGTGSVQIIETNTVSVIKIAQTAAGPNSTNLTAGGNITIVAGESGIVSTNGTITVNAGVNTIHFDEDVSSAGGPITFQSPIEVGADVLLTTGAGPGDIAFGNGAGDSVIDDGGGRNLTITAGTGDITVPGVIGGGANDFNNITITGNDITLTGIGDAAQDGANGAVVVTSADGGDNGRITLNGSHYRTGGTQAYTGGTDGVVTSFSAASEFDASAAITFNQLYLDHNGRTLTMLCDFTVGRLIFYRGTLNVNGRTLTTTDDIVVFGGAYDADDTDRAAAPANEFSYPEAGALVYYPAGGIYTPLTGVFGTAPNAVFSPLNGSTLTVGGDFYVNGSNMNGGAGWTLNVQDNTGANPVGIGPWGSPYAVAFNMAVSNCSTVTGGNVSATESVAAGDDNNKVTDSGGNQAYVPGGVVGWDFDRPQITSVETVYDNMLRITFSEPIENTNGEIAAVVAQIQFDGDTKPFTGTFFDSDGDQSTSPHTFVPTNTQDDLTTFFLQVSTAGQTWNTDATGALPGNALSTDRQGTHMAIVPDIDMLKGVFFDAGGHNMVKNYGENGEAIFAAATDQCRPALVNVVVGRAERRVGAEYIYDAHNYFHLRYSEPVDIGTAAGFIIADATAANVRAEATFAAPGAHGGGITDSGTTVGLTGYFTYPGRLPNGSRDGLPGATFYRDNTNGENPSGTHGLTVYIAGYRLNNAAVFPGYIGEAGVDDLSSLGEVDLTAVGASVSVAANAFIKDGAGNAVEPSSDSYDVYNPVISNNIAVIGDPAVNMPPADYLGWDVDPPSFSTYEAGPPTYYEIVSRATTATGLINRLEFFIHDDSADDGPWAPLSDHSDADPLHGVRDLSLTDNSHGSNPYSAFKVEDVNVNILVNTHNTGLSTDVDNTLFNTVNAPNDPYFTLNMNDFGHGWNAITALQISYDSSVGLITDLAGNLIPSTSLPLAGVERIPPAIELSLASVGDNRVYVRFTEPVFGNDSSPRTVVDASDFSFSTAGITITGIEAISYYNGGILDAWFTLSDSLTADTAFSGKIIPVVSSVFDKITNAMQTSAIHRVTDIGLGVMDPVWAADSIHNSSLYGTTDNTLRSFDGTGYLIDSNITLEASISAGSYQALSTRMYYDVDPPDSVLGDGFWLPTFNNALVPSANKESRSLLPYRAEGGVRDFQIPSADDEIVSGSEVQFLLQLGDLFCARLLDEDDPRTIIPWSFSIKDITRQAAGVTILNNVINPENGEKTILTYDLATSGMVVINVFNLSGDLVDVLHRGAQGAGSYTYTWDGKNRAGNNVARGIYFIRVVGPNIDEFRKVMIVK